MPSWWFNYSWEGRHSTRNYLIKLWYSTTKKGGVQREHLTKRADQVKDIKESVIWREKNRRGKGVRKTHFWCLAPHWLKGHKTERNTGFWRLAINTEMDWEGVWQKSWWGRQGSQQWKPCKLKIWFFFFYSKSNVKPLEEDFKQEGEKTSVASFEKDHSCDTEKIDLKKTQGDLRGGCGGRPGERQWVSAFRRSENGQE